MTHFHGFQPGMGRRLYAAADAAPDLPAPDTVRYELLGFMEALWVNVEPLYGNCND